MPPEFNIASRSTLVSSPAPFIPALAPTPKSSAWAVEAINRITQTSPIDFSFEYPWNYLYGMIIVRVMRHPSLKLSLAYVQFLKLYIPFLHLSIIIIEAKINRIDPRRYVVTLHRK